MSKRSQQKWQARSKEKKLAKRRMSGSSPLARLAGEARESCECWVSYQEQDNRMRDILVFRPVRGGGHVGAFFLIDYDCIGLKDAFYRLDVDVVEIREGLRARSRADGIQFLKINLDEAKKMVAGAIRWTRAHPYFRMPVDVECCVKIMEGVGDVENADVNDFGAEDGGLLYVGRERDLERRLVGVTLQEFMDREDVEVMFHHGDETFEEEAFEEEWDEDDPGRPLSEAQRQEMEEAEEVFAAGRAEYKKKMLEGARRWCFANAVAPEAELESAIDLMLAASAEGLGEEDAKTAPEKVLRAQEALLAMEDPEKRAAIEAAGNQLGLFVKSFDSEEAMLEALGFAEIGDDEDQENAEETSAQDKQVFELADSMVEACIIAVRKWCIKNRVAPEGELQLAAKLKVASTLAGVAAIDAGGTEKEARVASADTLLELVKQQDRRKQNAVMRALEQIAQCSDAGTDELVHAAMAKLSHGKKDAGGEGG